MYKLIAALPVAVGLLLLAPRDAFAYIDPGTGSYVIQMIVAGLLGAAYTVKVFWSRIRLFFARVFSRSDRDA